MTASLILSQRRTFLSIAGREGGNETMGDNDTDDLACVASCGLMVMMSSVVQHHIKRRRRRRSVWIESRTRLRRYKF